MTNYNTEKFSGMVITKHSLYMPPDARSYSHFVGTVSVLEGKEMLGFDVKDDSNWVARVESKDGTRSINLPGCQVQAVLQGDFGPFGTWAYEL